MKTTIVAPDCVLTARALDCAHRFRRGEFGMAPRKHHRDAVFLYPSDEGRPPDYRFSYRIDVWGDPAGRVTVHAYRAPPGGTV